MRRIAGGTATASPERVPERRAVQRAAQAISGLLRAGRLAISKLRTIGRLLCTEPRPRMGDPAIRALAANVAAWSVYCPT
jgi:hypothetical protein